MECLIASTLMVVVIIILTAYCLYDVFIGGKDEDKD